MEHKVYPSSHITKITSILLLAGNVWMLQNVLTTGPQWQRIFFTITLPFIIWAVPVTFFGRLEISPNGIAHRLGRFQWRWLPSVKWDTVRRIMDDSFLFWHTYRILTSDRIEWLSKKPVILCGNLTLDRPQEFLREVIFHVSSHTIVDQSVLDWVGLTHADVGRFYRTSRDD